jgi:hypothetical protein
MEKVREIIIKFKELNGRDREKIENSIYYTNCVCVERLLLGFRVKLGPKRKNIKFDKIGIKHN